MIRRSALAVAAVLAAVLTPAAAHAAAHPTTSAPACVVHAEQADGPGIRLTGTCSSPVSVAVWLAPSLSGNPIDVQTLFWSAVVSHVGPGPSYVPIVLPSGDRSQCFVQVDAAYGGPSIPYGPRLIADWHTGTVDCLTSPSPTPTPTPTTSSPPPTTVPPTTPAPSTSPSVTTPPQPTVTTVPPTPAPTTTDPTPPVVVPTTSLPPNPTTTISTTPPPRRHVTHPPTPTPTPTRSKPPTPAPTTSPPPTLPFTGAPTGALLIAAGAVAAAGVAFLSGSAYSRRRR